MPNVKYSAVENLIFSLTKSEKRFFKLFAGRIKGNEDSRFIRMFDHIDKRHGLDDEFFLKRNPDVKPSQLSNLKAHLYKQLLQSLRVLNTDDDLDLSIRSIIDYCTVLYNKCLYNEAIKKLRKAKKLAQKGDKTILLLQILEMEKKLALKLIRADFDKQITQLGRESENIQNHIGKVYQFSNLFNQIYAHYVSKGFIRNREEYQTIKTLFDDNLPAYDIETLSSDEKMYLFSTLVSYYYFLQDYQKGLRFSLEWVRLFEEAPHYILSKIEMYIRGLNNMARGHYKLKKYDLFNDSVNRLGAIQDIKGLKLTDNLRLQLFKYLATHKLNRYFLEGRFESGTEEIPFIVNELEQHKKVMDLHHVMVFYYKFACMHFGASQYQEAVYWLGKIINHRDFDFRADIQGFARILNLISHFELENTDLVEYYIRSTYRFLIKKEDVNLYQKHILRFLRNLPPEGDGQLQEAFGNLLDKLKELRKIPYEGRAFTYFDIISWLESKIQNRKVSEVIREKALKTLAESTNNG
ncbi:hypothetical protein FUAX_03850 [Fulvitalea axinellae]|uniref:Uncharacterized protein n=1 Tax=Fulvitalea axinellae TaxID=1182444 RepID=A0AAU9CIZ1_9BACT|nr:hypothetical protein FUAX_03850 [Fulvitalea axinellae]